MISRWIVHTRREHPLILWLVGLVLGQLLGLGHSLSVLFLVAILGVLALRRRVAALGLVLVVGFLSTYAEDPAARGYPSSLSYWVQIDAPPRFRHLGGIELSATVLGAKQGMAEVVTAASVPHRVLCRTSDVPWRNAGLLREGDRVWLRGTVHSLHGARPFSYEGMLARHGYQATCAIQWVGAPGHHSPQREGGTINRWVSSQMPQGERSALLRSMVLGTRDILSPETEALFRFFGITHLLVLSGFQVTLVYNLMNRTLLSMRWLLWRWVDSIPIFSIAAGGGFCVAVGLVACTGFEASANRALLAVALATVAEGYERRWNGALAIVGAAFLMDLWWPLVILEPAAALTFAALLGLHLGQRYGTGWWGALSSSLGASLCVSAVSMIWFPPPNRYGMVVGLIATPVFSWIILWGAILGLAVDLITGGLITGWLTGSAYLLDLLTNILEWLRRYMIDSGWG